MPARHLSGAGLAALLCSLAQPAIAADGATGRWLTDAGKAEVEIAPCGEALCGSIVRLQDPLDDSGQPRTDGNNPDPALRRRPIVGLPMLEGFRPAAEPGRWEGGRIYNPEDGQTYRSTMVLLSPDRLEVRGYVGLPLLGRSQVWTRVR